VIPGVYRMSRGPRTIAVRHIASRTSNAFTA
jgi:hypothetical protein